MKLKRFAASTMNEALHAVKAELGDDAVILSTRRVKGIDGKPSVEITAAIEQIAAAPQTPQATQATSTTADMDLEPTTFDAHSPLTEKLMAHGISPAISQRLQKAVTALMDTGFTEEDSLEMVLSKLITFKSPANCLKLASPLSW